MSTEAFVLKIGAAPIDSGMDFYAYTLKKRLRSALCPIERNPPCGFELIDRYGTSQAAERT